MIYSIIYWSDYEDISVGTSVGTLSEDKINALSGTYQAVFVSIEGDPVRIKFDGSEPTSTSGHKYGDGDKFLMTGKENLLNMKFILADGSSSATIRVTYGYFG